jgi:hypothetical protein
MISVGIQEWPNSAFDFAKDPAAFAFMFMPVQAYQLVIFAFWAGSFAWAFSF